VDRGGGPLDVDEGVVLAVLTERELAAPFPLELGEHPRARLHRPELVPQQLEEVEGELSVRSERGNDGALRFSVSDTGVGFLADKADVIFDAFFTTKPQGTGMGLRISRSIIESHGGRLWATTGGQRGATFSFDLPIKRNS
jgi:signal transduction histidine kinase